MTYEGLCIGGPFDGQLQVSYSAQLIGLKYAPVYPIDWYSASRSLAATGHLMSIDWYSASRSLAATGHLMSVATLVDEK